MKIPILSPLQGSRLISLVLLCASALPARAGTPDIETKNVETPVVEQAQPWRFSLAVPSWLAATSGTIGVNGVNSHVYMGADTLLKHLDMTASLSAEARKGRFGIYGDMLYVKASDAIYSDGLISKANIHLDQWTADLEVNYRVLEGPRGWLDLRAGGRYTDLYYKLVTDASSSAIKTASAQLVDDMADKVKDRLSEIDLKHRLQTVLEERIRARVTGRLDGLETDRPRLAIPPLGGGASRAVDDAVRKVVDGHLDDLAAALRAQVAADTAALKAAAQTRIDTLKNQIAKQIASTLKDKLSASASLNERWLDPYVGFAARYNLNKAFYLTGKADIGGFGLGSELTWQAYGALGCQVTRSIFVEAGYRYLYTDYNHGGFLYDVTQSGAQVTAGITF